MSAKGDGAQLDLQLGELPQNELLVRRSQVPTGLAYTECRQYLRRDFWFSCAYCTMSECEGSAIRFTIDHYEPQVVRKDLIDDYSNLMYACEECNSRKGDLVPPENAQADGVCWFRPDRHVRAEIFELQGDREIAAKNANKIGEFTILFADLNRAHLQRLRKIRRRLFDSSRYIAQGVMALRSFKLDQLPQDVRGNARYSIKQAIAMGDQIEADIDGVLRRFAMSPLDRDEGEDEGELARLAKRKGGQAALQALYPTTWRPGRKRA